MVKEILSENERIRLDRHIADAEKRTGTQIVLAVTEKSDSYAELPWKAFALGTAVAGLAAVLFGLLLPRQNAGPELLFAVVSMLATGGLSALLCIFLPGFARFFLDSNRAEVEVLQYAQSLFLSREVFATSSRSGMLLLISMFERRVVLLPDTGLKDRLSREAIQDAVAAVTNSLGSGQIILAFEHGLNSLEKSIAPAAAETGGNELPNLIVEEKDLS